MEKRKTWRLICIMIICIGLIHWRLDSYINRELVMTDSTHKRIVYLESRIDNIADVPIRLLLYDVDSHELQIVLDRITINDDPDYACNMRFRLYRGDEKDEIYWRQTGGSVLWMRYVIYVYPLNDLNEDLYVETDDTRQTLFLAGL